MANFYSAHSRLSSKQRPSSYLWLLLTSLFTTSCASDTPPIEHKPQNPAPLASRIDAGSLDTGEPKQGPLRVPALDFTDDHSLDRAQFLVAERALAADPSQIGLWRQRLKDYPLLPYLDYQNQIKQASGLNEAEVRQFEQNYPNSPLTKRLRAQWLSQLARNQDWHGFLRHYQPGLGEQFDCQSLQARWQLQASAKLAAEIRDVWLSSTSRAKGCQPLFDAWREAGYQTPELTWQRTKLALFAGNDSLASSLAKSLSADQQSLLAQWRQWQKNPKAANSYQFPHNADGAEFFSQALAAQARKQPQQVLQWLNSLGPDYPLTSAQRQQVQSRIALFLAVDFDPAASQYIDDLPAEAISPDLSLWYLRLQLRNQDWAKLIQGYSHQPASQRQTEIWRYWYARALEQQGQKPAADQLYRTLAQERSYYGYLSAARLGLPPRLNHRGLSLSAAQRQKLLNLPELQRAFELKQLGRLEDARREWRASADALPKAERPLIAIAAHHWGWHPQIISFLAAEKYYDDIALRFPTPYRNQVLQNCQQQDLSPGWVFALMRQESSFNALARSPAKAYGLMQLLPSTAAQLGDNSGGSALFEPDINIRYGTLYMRQMLDRFGHFAATTAAYNAGPSPVGRWYPRQAMETDLWVEQIPYKETRQYVQNLTTYRILYNQILEQDPEFYQQLAQDKIGG